MIPEGWEVKTVGELFNVQLGKMLNKEAAEKFPQYQYLGNSNVKWGCFNLSDLKTMHFSKKDREKFTLKSGDIVLCEGGEVGRCAIWRNDMEIYYQKALHRLRGNGGILPDFFQLYMEKIAGTKLLDNFTTRTSIAHLTREKLVRLPVKLPPLPEQKKIAKILSTWDKAITTTEQLLTNSQQQKKILMQQLLTGTRRLRGFDKNWIKKPISSFIKESRIQGSTGKQAKKITVKLYGRGVVSKDENRIGSESTKYYQRATGQFIYSKLDFLNGAFGIIPSELDRYESTLDLPAFDFLPNVNAKWFLYYVSREDFYSSNLSLANGGRKARRVNPKDFLSLNISAPCHKEQQAIAAVLSAADREIEVLQQKLAAFKQEKKALMQQLLTGKRRVKV